MKREIAGWVNPKRKLGTGSYKFIPTPRQLAINYQ